MMKLFLTWLISTLILYTLICIIKTAYLKRKKQKLIETKCRQFFRLRKKEKAEYYASEIEKLYVNLIFKDIINDMQGGFCYPNIPERIVK